MPISLGTQLGSHEITALLGKGGMGEVYRARDSKLKREVAIKILPEEFSQDSDRVNRFQREAEVLASLNHPNIAGIYDVEEASGSRISSWNWWRARRWRIALLAVRFLSKKRCASHFRFAK